MFFYWNIYILKNSIKFWEIPNSLKYNYLYFKFHSKMKFKKSLKKKILFYKFIIIFECFCRQENMQYFNKKMYLNISENYLSLEGITDIVMINEDETLPVNSTFYAYFVNKLPKVYNKKYILIEEKIEFTEEYINNTYNNLLQTSKNNTKIIKYFSDKIPSNLILSKWFIRIDNFLSISYLSVLKLFIDIITIASIFMFVILWIRTKFLNINVGSFYSEISFLFFITMIFSLISVSLFYMIKKKISSPVKREMQFMNKLLEK